MYKLWKLFPYDSGECSVATAYGREQQQTTVFSSHVYNMAAIAIRPGQHLSVHTSKQKFNYRY